MPTNIEDRVRLIIIEQLGVKPEEVTREAKFVEDLEADSLDTINLVIAFEEAYGIEIPDEKAEQMRSVGDVIDYLQENVGQSN